MKNRSKISVSPRKPLVKKLLVIEGVSRSGKFLLSDLLAGFADIEPVQTHVSLEHIPIFEKLGMIDAQTAREFLRCEIDVYSYETLIGRTLNLRKSDKSTIFNHPRAKEFLARTKVSDPQRLLKKFNAKSYGLFIAHELMPHITMYFDVFPQMKVLSLTRSPVDLASSWYKRGYGDRIAVDPTFFMIPFRSDGGAVPWYALPWKNDFYKMSPMDRIVRSLDTLFTLSQKSFGRLSRRHQRRVLFLSYEQIVAKPRQTVAKLKKFLGKRILPPMNGILKREKLPNPGRLFEKEKKLTEIKKLSSPKYFARLLQLEKKYQQSLKI